MNLKNMNILIIRSNPVNPDSRVEKEARSLEKITNSVSVLAWDRANTYQIKQENLFEDSENIKVYRRGIKSSFGAGVKNLFPLINFQMTIFYFLFRNRKKIDIIHACDFDTAFSAFIFSKIFGKKIVYDIFDYYVDAFSVPSKIKYIIEKLDHYIINNSDAVIITNESRKEQIKGTVPRKLEVVHNSPSKMLVKSNNEKSLCKEIEKDKRIKIVYVGILSENRFLKEISQIIQEKPNWVLYIGGFGEYSDYFKRKSLEIENIKFLGKMPYDQVLYLESKADVLFAIYNPTVPNHKYSSPNKLYEALMLGKPIIVAKNTGIDKFVEKFEIGLSIEYNIESMKKAFYKFEGEIFFRKEQIKKTTKEIFEKELSWEIMEKRLHDIYRGLDE